MKRDIVIETETFYGAFDRPKKNINAVMVTPIDAANPNQKMGVH